MHNNVPSSEYEAWAANFPSAGWVNGQRGDGTWTGGSAVLIDPHWVLTAGHNIKLTGTSPEYTNMQFGFGLSPWPNGGNGILADAQFVHPDYLNIATSPDIGLLYFEDPITGVEPAVRFRGTDTLGSLIHMVGYGTPGRQNTGYGTYDGVPRGSSNVLTRFGSATIPSFNALARFAYPNDPTYQRLGAVVSSGDSGGGWFIDVDGDYQLMGISGFYFGDYHYGSDSGALRLSLYNDWIDEVMASVPEPSTILLLGLSLAFLSRGRRPA